LITAELSSLERLLRRDRQIVVVSLVSVAAFAWIYTISGVGMSMNAVEMSRADRLLSTNCRIGDSFFTGSSDRFSLKLRDITFISLRFRHLTPPGTKRLFQVSTNSVQDQTAQLAPVSD